LRDAEHHPDDVEMRLADVAMRTVDVARFADFPTSFVFSSTSNGSISTSIRDGVERCACIATPKSFDVAAYGAGVEEWAMDVENISVDVAEISPGGAPGSLAAGRMTVSATPMDTAASGFVSWRAVNPDLQRTTGAPPRSLPGS